MGSFLVSPWTFAVLAGLLTLKCRSAVVSQGQMISQPLLGNTTFGNSLGDLDPRFRLRGRFGSDNVNAISMLSNAVNGIGDLAHLDFSSRVPEVIVKKLPRYQDVDITVKPVAPATDVEVRIAVWGIHHTVTTAIRQKAYRDADFDIYWDNVMVANCLVTLAARPGQGLGTDSTPEIIIDPNGLDIPRTIITNVSSKIPTADLTKATNLSSTSLGALTDIDPNLNPRFEFVEQPPGKNFSPAEVFATVLAVMNAVAEFPSWELAHAVGGGCRGFDLKILMGPEDNPPRSSTPILTWGYVIDTLRQIPPFMIEKKKWAELMFIIIHGRTIIGKGILEPGAPYPRASTATA